MGKFTMTHEIECEPDTFWKLFFDKTYNEKLFRESLGFPKYEVLEQKDTEKQIVRRVSGQPKMDLPGPVAKLLGSSFSYVEEGTFDKASKLWKWKMTPSTLADKMRNEGTIRIEAAGPGKCKRISEVFIEAKVFGLGGLLEGTAEKSLRDGYDKSAVFTNKYIRDGHAV